MHVATMKSTWKLYNPLLLGDASIQIIIDVQSNEMFIFDARASVCYIIHNTVTYA